MLGQHFTFSVVLQLCLSSKTHSFVVDRTVEENVHRLVQQRAAAMNLSAAAVSKRGAADEKSLTVRDIAMLLRSD